MIAAAHNDLDLSLEVLCCIEDRPPLSCEEIAEVCGCSPARIRRIERRALAKLRHPEVRSKLEPLNKTKQEGEEICRQH